MSDYIEIVRWEEFQHYTKRDPIWIKNYTRLLDDDAYRELTFAQRGLLHGLWLAYAKTSQRIPRNTSALSRYLGQKVLNSTVESLIHAGFIRVVASSTLARRYHVASPETEEETEIEKEHPKYVDEEFYEGPPTLQVVGWEGVLRDI